MNKNIYRQEYKFTRLISGTTHPTKKGATTKFSAKKSGAITAFAPLKTGAITAFADAGGGQVTVTSAGHTLSNGDAITISGTTSYNGNFTVANVTTNTFEITDTFVADDATGTWVIDNVVVVTSAGHGLVNGEAVTIAGTTSYNGNFTVSAVTTDTYQIVDDFVADDATGTWVIDNVVVVTSFKHGLKNGYSVTISGTTSYNGTFTVRNVDDKNHTFEITDDFVADDATGTWVLEIPAASSFPLPILHSGTITAQGKTIIGSGTKFTSELHVDKYIYADGVVRKIKHIFGDDMLELDDPFPADGNVSGVALFSPENPGYKKLIIKNTHASATSTVQEQTLAAGDEIVREFVSGQAPVSYDDLSGTLEFQISE